MSNPSGAFSADITKDTSKFEDYQDFINDFQKFKQEMQIYSAGIKEIKTKLEILDEDFKLKHNYNPIHHIETRLKKPESIFIKLKKKGQSLNEDSMRENVLDIAGIRVVCNYINDIEKIASTLLRQNDLNLITRNDYINNPKKSGYRSLHLVIEVPIFLSDSQQKIPVEIQIRTLAMDFWASLEHKLKYKTNNVLSDDIKYRLKTCASAISSIDEEMQEIQIELAKNQNNFHN